MKLNQLTNAAIELLKNLIETPSFSSEEHNTAVLIGEWLNKNNIPYKRVNNNIWASNKHYDIAKPNLLLNSHHDTVKPNSGYTKDPFEAIISDGKLYGLGSNDAGGSLVSLLATFVYFYNKKSLQYNLILVASAEEESSGPAGLNSMLNTIPKIDVAIVGEPTQMQWAIAEKGLVVFDATVSGKASHAAHPNSENPIYKLPEVLNWFKKYEFAKVSDTLGPVKMTVTQIQAGKQHNAVPAEVKLVIDVRVNDCYTNEEIVSILQQESPCEAIVPRGIRHNSSSIPVSHPLVQSGLDLGRLLYGSPTLSDQSVLNCPSLKLGPGDSTRSHTADEYIYLEEIRQGIEIYTKTLNKIL